MQEHHFSDIPNWVCVIQVGGIPTPLINMKVNRDDDIPTIWENNIHVPNHQSVLFFNPQTGAQNVPKRPVPAALCPVHQWHQWPTWLPSEGVETRSAVGITVSLCQKICIYISYAYIIWYV